MAEDGRKQALRIGAGEGVLVGVADSGRFDLDQYLTGFRAVQLHGLDGEWLARFERYGRSDIHVHQPFSTPEALAMWVAMKSISGGDRQS